MPGPEKDKAAEEQEGRKQSDQELQNDNLPKEPRERDKKNGRDDFILLLK